MLIPVLPQMLGRGNGLKTQNDTAGDSPHCGIGSAFWPGNGPSARVVWQGSAYSLRDFGLSGIKHGPHNGPPDEPHLPYRDRRKRPCPRLGPRDRAGNARSRSLILLEKQLWPARTRGPRHSRWPLSSGPAGSVRGGWCFRSPPKMPIRWESSICRSAVPAGRERLLPDLRKAISTQ